MPEMTMTEKGAAAREQVKSVVMPALLAHFAGKVEEIPEGNDLMPQVWATPDIALSLALWLREQGFNMLVDIGGADYYPKREPRFEVVYIFRQLPALGMIRVRVRCTEKDLIPSLSATWPMANAAEREVYDMFGIKFKDHPNLKRLFNPDDWEGYPLRRDYPLHGPRALINLEMPADENTFRPFVDVTDDKEGK